MPRKHKNKSHARRNHHQVPGDTQEAQASAAAAPKEECPSSPSSAPQGSPRAPLLLPIARSFRGPWPLALLTQGLPAQDLMKVPGAQRRKVQVPPRQRPAVQSTRIDPLARRARMLVDFLLDKYTKKEPITQKAMMKVVSRKYKPHYPEIFRYACERVELVFGLELKEVDRVKNIYALNSKLNLGGDEGPSDEGAMPKSGLLMLLLGVIFMHGNRATEEVVWQFLNAFGVYAGRRHWIFGEPRRLITKDLVQKEYLKYRQVPNSDPPRYEFLWGPRACAETSKMKVLEVLAKVYRTVPSSFPDLYDEALRDQAERAGQRGAARAPTTAEASAPSRGQSPCSSSHI